MIVGLDIDGVIADFKAGWTSAYKTWFDRDATKLDEWDAITTGTHFETEAHFWTWARSVPGFWRNLPPVPGALGGIYDLLQSGHRIVLITNRSTDARLETFDWLEAHWPKHRTGLPEVNFVKHGEKGKIPAQIYVDDSPRELTALKVDDAKPVVIRFKRAWNRDLQVPGLLTAATWTDLVDLVDGIARGDDFTSFGDGEDLSFLDQVDPKPTPVPEPEAPTIGDSVLGVSTS